LAYYYSPKISSPNESKNFSVRREAKCSRREAKDKKRDKRDKDLKLLILALFSSIVPRRL